METAQIPADETRRLARLRSYRILDTHASPRFDNLTKLASIVLDAPIALISLVDEDRQWSLSCHGLDVFESGRDVSLCAHAILGDDVFVVPDVREDLRFADNPLVIGFPGIRFYAGAPLRTPDGFRIGTFCVIDTVPRSGLSDSHRAALTTLAATVVDEFELRRVADELHDRPADLERHNAVIGVSTDFIGLADAGGDVISVNPAGRAMTGLSVDEPVTGLRVGVFHPPEWAEYIRSIAIPAAIASGSWRGETELLARDGSRRPVDQVILCHRDEKGDVAFLSTIARDLSDRFEVARLRERQELRDTFVAAVSHELRTPLTSIVAALDMIDDGVLGAVPPEISEVLGIARDNSDRLVLLVDRLLDFGKERIELKKLNLVSVPLRSIVDRSVGVVRAGSMAKDVEVTSDCRDVCDLRIECDAFRLEQVIVNLLSNALKVSSPGSVVRVEVAQCDGEVRLSVTDEGPGIDPEDLDRLFEPFWQGSRSTSEGAGLGLAICREIVDAHHGTIAVESTPGAGTTFTVSIPVSQPKID